ncbi:FAD-dependent oxidoreductase [Pseudodesulfovibrio senegalensis]|jgi:heterodisulfide reductase subunit A|uniref:4Fe-4S dicluster domain-containing protein n=1 Tax=Pseudodesulfovibrio senegalensis TaxID=1721087 RepID=A0A6N6N4V5_9BACT|nr:FAD-dependent oxidoreductase [Pseudodesulfovibrio senegalensis]KAB1443212.1 4Fe-4S dicluster domain-containing protein [Pseudodesulfovibrio senegalensis]
MRDSYGALVVGAGVAGIHAALDLAETGHKVALIDSRANMGGLLSQLDHQFPSDHCGMCKMLPLTERDSSSQFCLRKGLFHRNIDLRLMTELDSLQGDPGQFHATIRTRSTFVDPHKCIGCGQCSEVCPVRVPSEFNAGLTERAAIHLPVPQHVPNHYAVDLDNCVRCLECVKACPTGAIDFRLDERKDFPVLVADADASVGRELAEWFKEREFPLTHAADSVAAVTHMESQPVSLVMVSLGLPDDEVRRIISRAKELDPNLPVHLVLDEGQTLGDDDRKALIEMGASRDMLQKPLQRAAISNWLEKRFMRQTTDTRREFDVGAVILASGFECFNPKDDPEGMAGMYMYGDHPGVVTSIEFERLISSSGMGGRGKALVRPGDGRPVKKIAWLQCVGSRDERRKAGFCSSFCCMVSIKEALLARRRAREAGADDLETTIFSMDMRTFGKDFQRYRDNAEGEEGVRFVKMRIHSLVPAGDESNSIRVQYPGDDLKLVFEDFDMVVLGVGARPPKSIDRLAEVTGIRLNEWNFCETKPYMPSRTSELGVMAAGVFGGPRDIAESVILSGAAALEASRLINIYAPLKEQEPDPEPEYRDVSRERPRMLLALCTSCPLLEQELDFDALTEKLSALPSVCAVARVGRTCSGEGWEEIHALVKEHEPNRILVGACMPYAYVPRLRELGDATGLNPALMDVADVYTPLMNCKGACDPDELSAEVVSLMEMAAVKLLDQDPSPLPRPLPVFREALVVGGGLAGMTAALGVADHGYNVCLVEESEALGGMAMKLHYTLEDDDPHGFMENLVEQVIKHPHIRVFTNGRVTLSTGRAGRFMSLISSDDGTFPLEHGATILATGGREARVYDYGFRVHKSVLSQRRLEDRLASGELDLAELDRGVAMIQCWRSREESRNYCSRVCCAQALKNIRVLKKRRPDLPVYVFYRDIMSYGFSEKYYTEARKLGAIFIQYDLDNRPEVRFEDELPVITAMEPILNSKVEIRPDLLVLSVGLEPNETDEIREIFGVETNQDGFFREAESKWRPVDFAKQGVFMCGVAHSPGNMNETVASAKAAAQRALGILTRKALTCSNTVAGVRESLCSLCGKCITACPYDARSLDITKDRIIVDELLCQGCGACAAACPNSASYLRGFTDNQIMSVIDAALETVV